MKDKTLWRGKSEFGEYEVVEQLYNGRPARVLLSGGRTAAQSGVALDDKPELLFDYNQRFLEIIEGTNPQRALLIGGGAMTFPAAVLKALPDMALDVVELDPLLLSVAEQHFDFAPSAQLNIFHGDGRTFLEHNKMPYDVILLDAFSDLEVAKPLATLEATQAIHRKLTAGGLLAMNLVSPYYGRAASVIRHQLAAYTSIFQQVQVFPADPQDSGWQNQNLVLVAQKSADPQPLTIRSRALPPLDLVHDRSLRD